MLSPQDQMRQDYTMWHLRQKVRELVQLRKRMLNDSRGYANLCTREEEGAAITATAHVHAESIAPNHFVQTLLERVGQLESRLRSRDETAGTASPVPPQQPSQDIPQSPVFAEQADSPAHDHMSTQEATITPGHEDLGTVAPDDEDAATVLEFLAWGRSKDVEYGTTSQQQSRLLDTQEDDRDTPNIIFDCTSQASLDLLETLLPLKAKIRQLVDYHNTYLLWYHGSYCSGIFKDDLDVFLDIHDGNVRHPDVDVQWLALLFAILTGSLACAPPDTRHSWGFTAVESSNLALRWYEASIMCLNTGRYIERHTIYSVEAVATLTIAAHILGRSNSQSILLSSAGRIAQSIGLHRLSPEADVIPSRQLRQREAGRRVFNQLCTQDWFQIPFSESYSLNPHFITTSKPMNCDDDLEPQPESVPTQTSYCNYRYEIAALMPPLLDATLGCNTLFTKYEQVLNYDEKMRKLATQAMPTFLSTSAVIAPAWPVWIRWARRSLAICAAHKIIMIHRRFLGLSFTNTAFAFTRRTCVAAAKTILKEALSTSDQSGPVLWIEQAFSVAAGIVLSLDIAHRDHQVEDLENHNVLMGRTIGYLKSFQGSKIASRGARLLSSLQVEMHRGSFRGMGKRQRVTAEEQLSRSTKRPRVLSPGQNIAQASQSQSLETPTTSNATEYSVGVHGSTWDTSIHDLPFDFTLGPQGLFDDLLSFQL